jgi:hypothetical protein
MKTVLALFMLIGVCFGQHLPIHNIQGNCDAARVQVANYIKMDPFFEWIATTPTAAIYRAVHPDSVGNVPSLMFEFETFVQPINPYEAPLKSFPKEERDHVAALRAQKAANTCRVYVTQKNTKDRTPIGCLVEGTNAHSAGGHLCGDAFEIVYGEGQTFRLHIHEKMAQLAFGALGVPGMNPNKYVAGTR